MRVCVCVCVCVCVGVCGRTWVCVCLQACKYAMRVCAPVVGSEQITTMFQNHLHDDKGLHYGEFINDLTKYIVSGCAPTSTHTLGTLFFVVCLVTNDYFGN